MDEHGGQWPRNWEDLGIAPNGNLDQRVEVDWSADPKELLKMPRPDVGPPFRVIYLRNGRSTHFDGREPNQMILDFLEARQSRKTAVALAHSDLYKSARNKRSGKSMTIKLGSAVCCASRKRACGYNRLSCGSVS